MLTIGLISVLKQGKIPVIEKISEVVENIPVTISQDYTTSTIRYIIATEDLTITLNDINLNRFYIKSMANVTVKTKSGKIDGEWEEISMGPQSSIEVLSDKTNWFILSSDGLKNS